MEDPDFTITGVEIRGVGFDTEPVDKALGRTSCVDVVLAWATKSAGFGELSFRQYNDGRLEVHTEMLGRDFAGKVLQFWLAKAQVVE